VFNSACSSSSLRLLPLPRRMAAGLLLTAGFASAVNAQVATTTHLSVPVPSVAVGVPTLLQATVTDAASHAVLLGTVTFYDGSRALGSAQIVSGPGGAFAQGTAHLKTASLSPGANSITAVFAGTTSDLASTSAAKTVTVTGKNATTTALAATSSGEGNTLTATLRAFGVGPLPTGSVNFLDTTTDTALGSVPLSGATWAGNFSIGSTPALGSQALGAATADFNGDGFLDLVTSFPQAVLGGADHFTAWSTFMGHGDGTFTAVPGTFITAGLNEIVAGDFNNDGKADLAINAGASIGVWLGNGDGTFQGAATYAVEAPMGLSIGDVNRDGKLDLITGQTNGMSNAQVLLGNGDGTFQPAQSYATNGFEAYGVAVGDFDRDGIPDLLVATIAGLTVLPGKGDGTFELPTSTTPYGVFPDADPFEIYILIGDFNGDGKLDVAATRFNNAEVFLGNGDGTFEPPVIYSFESFGSTLGPPFAVDINQDGKTDLVVAGSDFLGVLLGNGDGTFEPEIVSDVTGATNGPAVQGDMNGDGFPDLVLTSTSANTSTGAVFLAGRTASLQLADVTFPSSGTSLAEAIYSGDGSFAASTSIPLELIQYTINFSGGFSQAGSGLQLNGGAAVVGNTLELTNGGLNEATSAFATTPVNIQAFTTDFTFQILDPVADGFTFAIQNNGPGAVGQVGGGLGYGHIRNSLAIKFDIYNNLGEGTDSTGLYTDGASPTIPAIDLSKTGISLGSGDSIKAHITYDGASLTITLTDVVTLATWSYAWAIDIPATVGATTAYVGFTGGSGVHTSTETIAAWSYLAGTPAPNYPVGILNFAGLQFNGSAEADGVSVVLTQGGVTEAGSSFYKTPQNVQLFTTDFAFQLLNANADGFTFTIQNGGPGVVGTSGSGLGYDSIPKSVAVKFDLYNNSGEGFDSTGLYTDGASPTVPALDLSSAGINLHSGDVFDAHVTYDGTNLTLTLTDRGTTFSHSWPIDIPGTVGGTTAYVGFTGATGGLTSYDTIFTWTYHPGVP